jgi:predicted Zn-dependent protease
VSETLTAALLVLLAAGGVAYTQPRVATTAHEVKASDDVYDLPPPSQLRAAALGWDAAAVDLLWSSLLVEYGSHWSEHRDMKTIPQYVDAILALEPTYAPIYRYVDTLLAYRPMLGTEQDVRLARAYLERGTRERPDDAKLWSTYGQFLAFIGPSFLTNEAEKDAWRKDGAEAMGHAVEVGGDADAALSAATMLTRAGATQAAIRYLEHAYAFTEHPSMAEVHESIGRRLASLEATAVRDAADAQDRAIDARWAEEMKPLSRSLYLMLGPAVDAAKCAGLEASVLARCKRDWDGALEP